MGLDEIFFWKWNDLGTETLFKSEKDKISLKKVKSAQNLKNYYKVISSLSHFLKVYPSTLFPHSLFTLWHGYVTEVKMICSFKQKS